MFTHKRKRAQSILEYIVFISVLMMGFIVMQRFFAQGIYGKWKSAGDQLGYGRQYEYNLTDECTLETRYHEPEEQIWYEPNCFKNKYWDKCFGSNADYSECKASFLQCECKNPPL